MASGRSPQVDLIDEVYIEAPAQLVADAVHDPRWWRRAWPDLSLSVRQDRDEQGLRFAMTGGLVGSCELWVQPQGRGCVLHFFLRGNFPEEGATQRRRWLRRDDDDARRLARELRRRSWQAKRAMNDLKDRLEAGRPVGMRYGEQLPPAIR